MTNGEDSWVRQTSARDVATIKANMRLPLSPSGLAKHHVGWAVMEHQNHLSDGMNYWLDEDVTDLADDLRHVVPLDCCIESERLPSPYGLVLLERPLRGICWNLEASPDGSVPMQLVSWMLHDPSHYIGTEYDDTFLTVAVWFYASEFNRWLPAGCHGWELDVPIGQLDGVDNDDDLAAQSSLEDLQLLLAILDLVATDEIIERVPYARSKRERKEFASGRKRPEVIIASLRGAKDTRRGGTSGHSLGVRFYVRPHYRQQPYGPGRQKRRRILVPGHWKGPEGAPIYRPERVYAVRDTAE